MVAIPSRFFLVAFPVGAVHNGTRGAAWAASGTRPPALPVGRGAPTMQLLSQ